jgi:type I restriction enzyme S subunit
VIIPLPQIDEQLMISKFIDEKLGSINKKINEISREIILIKEYSTRLIADVVTGKLDVRAVASQLPEDIEEEEIDIDDEPEEDDELEEALEP